MNEKEKVLNAVKTISEYCKLHKCNDCQFGYKDKYCVLAFRPNNWKIKEENNEQEKQGEWIEFEIDEDGFFNADDCGDSDEEGSFNFQWHQWSEFLNYSYGEKWRFTAFGGWKYRDCEAWYMFPQMFSDDHYVNVAFKGEDNIKPAVPVKIRFWRKAK